MNEIMIFDYGGTKIRTVEKEDGIWWVLVDVCKVLDLSNPTMLASRLDDDERTKSDLGRQGETWIINESGLYNVILRSDKPEARPFRKWVTAEVLPSIRKHGAYMTPETLESAILDPDTIIMIATALKNERAEKNALQAELDRSKEWYSIKRVAQMNGRSYKDFDWRKLKSESVAQGYGIKKIFDANYGEVNTYHMDVWEKAYPTMEL